MITISLDWLSAGEGGPVPSPDLLLEGTVGDQEAPVRVLARHLVPRVERHPVDGLPALSVPSIQLRSSQLQTKTQSWRN